MADINEVISLGIGTPADIGHFILVGLSPSGTPSVGAVTGTVSIGGVGATLSKGAGVVAADVSVLGVAPGASVVSADGAITVTVLVAPLGIALSKGSGAAGVSVTVSGASPFIAVATPREYFVVGRQDRVFKVRRPEVFA